MSSTDCHVSVHGSLISNYGSKIISIAWHQVPEPDVPFAKPQNPARNNKQTENEYQEHCARTYCHECFENETRIEIDPVQGANTATRCIRKQLAVQQHDPTDQIQAEKHRYGKYQIDWHLGYVLFLCIRWLCDPYKIEITGYWMYKANKQLG